MIKLVTGTPGSGKSLYAVSQILELKKQFPDRQIYADIDGLNVPDVERSPDDWRECPDNSIVIYDEAQQHERFRAGTSANKDEIVQALQVHRHRGFDIWFITQSPRFLNNFVIDLVGEHYHLHRPFGAKLATVYYWRSAQKQPQSVAAQDRTENQFLFRYPKDLFTYYKSATQHNVKLKIPRALWIVLIVIIALIALIYKMYFSSGTQNMIHPEKQAKSILKNAEVKATSAPAAPAAAAAPAAPAAPLSIAEVEAKRVSAVFATSSRCNAYNGNGDYIEIDEKTCRDYANNPFKLKSAAREVVEQRLQAVNYQTTAPAAAAPATAAAL